MSTHAQSNSEYYTVNDVQLAAAEAIGAYRREHYHQMEDRCLALLAIARRRGASRDLEPIIYNTPMRAAEDIVEAFDNDRFDEMARLTAGLRQYAIHGGDPR